MKKIIYKIATHQKVYPLLLKFWVKLDNVAYSALTRLAILGNEGMHPKHRILNYHKFFVDNIESDDVVIDIGCGNGANAYDIGDKAKKVIGIDIEQKNIDKAKKKYNRENVTYILGDVTVYPFEEGKFDKIVLSNVLEHIEDRVEFLKKLHIVSDTILLRVPMIDRDWLTIFKKEQGMEYRLDLTHFTEYTVKQVKEECAASEWEVESYSVQFGEFWGVLKSKR